MGIENKMYTSSTLTNAVRPEYGISSKMRVNRVDLLSKAVAEELNTYISFDPFPTFNDLFAPEYKDGKEVSGKRGAGTPGVRSLFNKAGAVIIGDTETTSKNITTKKASEFRISNNVPLMDNPATRLAIKRESGCTVRELVEASQQGMLGRETYSYSDFMYCKYLGRISNNYMVTLRRFPYPVDDFISSLGEGESRSNPDYTTQNADSMGCLVTWMGTPGNDMSNILKYSVTMPFTETSASLQDDQTNADSGGGIANQIAAVFDPTYQRQYMEGGASSAANKVFERFAPALKDKLGDAPYPASQYNNYRDTATKAYGPIDVIKKTYKRGEEGLDFSQSLTLTFDYELRSYNGINGRQAMLDLLSNILNVTYSTGTFWGGGFRGGGAHQNNIFSNLSIYKANGGFTSFVDAFADDCTTIGKGIKTTIQDNGGVWETIKSMANNLGGMLLAGVLNKMGRPQKHTVNAMLSPAPIGFWHVTVGNPHHPIMSMGNMILTKTNIEHYGPLGLDDFPTGLKVTCELTRGKSRDIRDIEKLYMHGNDRIYTSMGPKIFDMYKYSKEYKGNARVPKNAIGNANSEVKIGENTVKIENIGVMKKVLQKYFGHADTTSIIIASMEQENGANGKKKSGTAGGDSSVQGNK